MAAIQSSPSEIDLARIVTLVTAIPLAVDLGRYDLAEAAFAPEVVIDYTSLWGGEPQRLDPAALIEAWRGLVPGFDATYHELGPVAVEIEGNQARAVASVDARHWLDGAVWRPAGTYRWTLGRIEGAWKVTSMTLILTRETGDRSLVARAAERAALSR